MAEILPVKLVDVGSGVGQLREFESGDTINTALTAVTLSDSAASTTLPTTGSAQTVASLLQTIRNNLKSIISGSFFSGLTAKTTLADADTFTIVDSEASNAPKKVTWALIKSLAGGGGGGMSATIWQAGVTNTQGHDYISPADWETYRRVAADGTDTVDPADDTTKYRSASYERILALSQPNIVRGMTIAVPEVTATASISIPSTLTRAKVLGVTGRGYVSLLLVTPTTPAAFAIGTRFEVIIDGRTVLDCSITSAANGSVPIIAAAGNTTSGAVESIAVQFRRTLDVYITSSPSAGITAATLHHRVVSKG